MAQLTGLEVLSNSTEVTPRLELPTLVGVVDGLRAVTPLETLCEELNLTEDEVFKIVTGLGTWLIHAHGAAPGDIVFASEQKQLSLLPDSATVVVPLGFDRRQGRRYDVRLSIRAIIAHNPDGAELARYIDRQFPNDQAVLMGRDVFNIWRFATLDELDDYHEGVSSKTWASVMLEAYNLLDVSLSDAQRAARRLAHAKPLDTQLLGDTLTKLAWLNESRVRKVSALLELHLEKPTVESERILQRETELFVKELLARPRWMAASIGQLSQGQVLRLVERNGLGLAPETRSIEAEVRRGLTARNLKRDFDLLVADGVRATLLGSADVFWSALDARAEGDTDWRVALDAALENA